MKPPVHQTLVSKWELGHRTPNSEEIARLAEIFKVPIEELTTKWSVKVHRAHRLIMLKWEDQVRENEFVSPVPYRQVEPIHTAALKNDAVTASAMPPEKKAEDLNRPVSAFLDSLFDTPGDKRQLQYGIAPNELPLSSRLLLYNVLVYLQQTTKTQLFLPSYQYSSNL